MEMCVNFCRGLFRRFKIASKLLLAEMVVSINIEFELDEFLKA